MSVNVSAALVLILGFVGIFVISFLFSRWDPKWTYELISRSEEKWVWRKYANRKLLYAILATIALLFAMYIAMDNMIGAKLSDIEKRLDKLERGPNR